MYHICPEESTVKNLLKKKYKGLEQEQAVELAAAASFHTHIDRALESKKLCAKPGKPGPTEQWADPAQFPVSKITLKKVAFQPTLKSALGRK